MFERFSDEARRAVVLALEEARVHNHNYIGTEHFLLGLTRENEGVAAMALESLGITLETLSIQVAQLIGEGDSTPAGHIPFTSRAKKALELSLTEALDLGHTYIGTGHLLLALIRESDVVATEPSSMDEASDVDLVTSLGVDLDELRREVIDRLSAPG